MSDPTHESLQTYQDLFRSPQIFEHIRSTSADSLRIQKLLRADFPEHIVPLALTLNQLREKAARRGYPNAEMLWFDRVRFEQATSWPVAQYKAQRFHGEIHDWCCGAGVDTLALTNHGHVHAVDMDPLACQFTTWNADALNVSDQASVHVGQVEQRSTGTGFLHVDPDRRRNSTTRAVRLEDYEPPLEWLQAVTQSFPGGAIKLSPASNFGGKFDDVECELISLNGECKEATIWFGDLRGDHEWRATALPTGETISGDPLAAEPELAEPQEFLLDPDPALVRAGLIDLFCHQSNIQRLDLAEEYLTAETPVTSAFVTNFRLLAELPNNERILKKELRARNAGPLEIKARRLPVPIDRLQKSLPQSGDTPLTIIFARINSKSRILIAERITT